MKKSILILTAAAFLFSCKKEKTAGEFTPTDVTGTTVVSGSVSKNVITPDGIGGWINTTRVPVQGINVSVKINKSALYPGSQAVGADVYTATTDAQGKYSMTVKTNASGTQALITVDGFSGTLDTLINGVTKTGLYATFAGASSAPTLFMGANHTFNHPFTANNVSTNPNNINIGNATITGSVGMSIFRRVETGTVVTISNTVVPVPAGTKVYLNFTNDPTLLTMKQYNTTTDAMGSYTFNIPTVAAGTAGFPQNALIWMPDYATTRDTMKYISNTFTGMGTGLPGVYNGVSTTQSGVYNTEIRNAVNLSYTTFTAN